MPKIGCKNDSHNCQNTRSTRHTILGCDEVTICDELTGSRYSDRPYAICTSQFEGQRVPCLPRIPVIYRLRYWELNPFSF